MSSPLISYAPRFDATPEGELGVLESIYSLAIRRFEQEEQRGGPAKSRPDDARKDQDAGTHSHCT